MSLLKWVGGKKQILSELEKFFPKNINVYYELFAGGGSVFINLLELCEKKAFHVEKFVINDINSSLIGLYKDIQTEHAELINCLSLLSDVFLNLPETKTSKRVKITPPDAVEKCKNRKMFYYWVRLQYNKIPQCVLKSAYFVFLNRVGFRGLYRENRNREFNVPYGNYSKLTILNKKAIMRLHKLFNKYDVSFTNKDFSKFQNFEEGDFVYLDPPYYPLDAKSFTSYTSNDFGLDQHENIIKIINKINPTKFVMSNSFTTWIINKTKDFHQKKIMCRRRINSKKPNATASEIIVYN